MLKFCVVLSAVALALPSLALASGGQNDELVSTDTESLIEAYAQAQGLGEYRTQDMADIREFVGCFVSGLDLPREVYMQCAVSVVQTAAVCREAAATPACVTAVAETVGACKLPVKNVMDSAAACMKDIQD